MVAAPLSPEELLARADLAGYAQVTGLRDGWWNAVSVVETPPEKAA
jgi:hypothetical protein